MKNNNKSFYIPPGKTEQEVLDIIEQVVKVLAPSFVMGYMDKDDMMQEGRIFAMECLRKYNPNMPLNNFLFIHVKRRFCNLRRNKLHRNDPPCSECSNGEFCEPGGCKRFKAWKKRNSTKANLMRPNDINDYSDSPDVEYNEITPEEKITSDELKEKIDDKLPVELRADYLRLLSGQRISKSRKDIIMEAVRNILCPPKKED